jgi:microcystin degradation protein MlrC
VRGRFFESIEAMARAPHSLDRPRIIREYGKRLFVSRERFLIAFERLQGVAFGPLWDPQAVRIAFDAGQGARLPMRLGGKVSPLSGDPVDAECEVLALRRGMTMSGLDGLPIPLGDCALVETAGVKIVLATLRTQAFGTDLFSGLGLDPRRERILVLKSSQHFHAAYAPIASSVVYVDAPGSCSGQLDALPYRRIRRPKWPLDEVGGSA